MKKKFNYDFNRLISQLKKKYDLYHRPIDSRDIANNVLKELNLVGYDYSYYKTYNEVLKKINEKHLVVTSEQWREFYDLKLTSGQLSEKIREAQYYLSADLRKKNKYVTSSTSKILTDLSLSSPPQPNEKDASLEETIASEDTIHQFFGNHVDCWEDGFDAMELKAKSEDTSGKKSIVRDVNLQKFFGNHVDCWEDGFDAMAAYEDAKNQCSPTAEKH